jgi:proteasome accessory factor B
VVRFANARITRALVSEEHYSIPETFSINELMTSRFGIMTGEREHHVRVRFSAEQAPYVFKRTWHAGQKIRENGDGTVEIEF